MGWRPRLRELDPTTVRVTHRGHARICVRGTCFGWVRAGDLARRWVWGAFEETFPVPVAAGQRSIAVVAQGLLGRAVAAVAIEAVADVAPPAAALRAPGLQLRLPRVRGPHVATRPPRVPHTVRLRRAPAPRADHGKVDTTP